MIANEISDDRLKKMGAGAGLVDHNGEGRGPQARLLKTAFFGDFTAAGQSIELVFTKAQREKIARITDFYPVRVTSANFEECLPQLQELEVIFCTWGMLALTDEQVARLPALQAVFYAAGTVKGFAMPYLRRGIKVTSSREANARPVAEFTLAQILLVNKGYFRNVRDYRAHRAKVDSRFRGAGNLGLTVSLLGLGKIGRLLLDMLAPFDLRALAFDPFLSAEQIRGMGAEKVDLAEAFERGNVVSNHLADVPETEGLISGKLLSSMPRNGAFINTGRGRTVREDELADALRARTDLSALLDVTYPEPPAAASPLWELPNVMLSGHIAGSIGNETARLADLAIEEFERWSRGEPLQHEVTLENVDLIA